MLHKSTVPKQQHWVPKVYLKQFATADSSRTKSPKVWVWDKATRQARNGPVRVDTICSSRYLYTPQLVTGFRDPSMETELGHAETRAGELWPTVLGSQDCLLDTAVRGFLAEFVALLHLRNIWIYDTMNKAVSLVRKLYPRKESGTEAVDGEDPVNFAKGAFVETIRSSLERVTNRLRKKRWVILDYDQEVVVTGDRPVLFCVGGRLVGGPFQKETVTLFPLSPNRLLYMDDRETHLGNVCVPGPPEVPSMMNALLGSHALRIVVGSKPFTQFQGIPAHIT